MRASIPPFLIHVAHFTRRKIRQYPKSSFLLFFLSFWFSLYLFTKHLHTTTFGRYWWNYSIYYIPPLAYILPSGGWGPIENNPRWIQEIYDAPWMGEWTVPHLTSAVYRHSHFLESSDEFREPEETGSGTNSPLNHGGEIHAIPELNPQIENEPLDPENPSGMEHLDDMVSNEDAVPIDGVNGIGGNVESESDPYSNEDSDFSLEEITKSKSRSKRNQRGVLTSLGLPNPSLLSSPSLIKLHVFSSVSEKARQKRMLIRKLSPVFNVPPEYRHLIEMKFVLGHAYNIEENWAVDEEMEALLSAEQEEYGDMLRLNLSFGENLRWGKILDWIEAVGNGKDGGRESWWLFKVDDDSVLKLPNFLDTLITLNPRDPYYLGSSLNRWPAYHHHFTGMTTGFSWPVVKTLAAGIARMPRQEIEKWWDDDVLTGEITFCLPPKPECRSQANETHFLPSHPLPDHCNPHIPYPGGWLGYPPYVDPRSGLIRYDFLRRMGDPACTLTKGDVVVHAWKYKFNDGYEKEWHKSIEGTMWEPPHWMIPFAERL